MLRFAQVSRQAGAVGILNSHIFADGTEQRLDALQSRRDSSANPFVLGTGFVGRYYQILDECLQAAEARPLPETDWAKRLSPEAMQN